METVSFDPDVLYDRTPLPEMTEWLAHCELHREALGRWEKQFIEQLRQIFDTNVRARRMKPFSGRQLAVLKQIWEKLP